MSGVHKYPTISFRVSPREREIIEAKILASGILCSTGWTKTTVTTKRNKFESATFTATVHCTTKRRVTAVDHAINIFNDRFTRV